MEYVIFKDDKVHYYCGKLLPKKGIKVKNWNGVSGQSSDFYDLKTGYRLPEEDLIKKGLLEDNRGLWYRKETFEPYEVIDLNEVVDPEKYTRLEPIKENGEISFFNEFKKDKWAINRVKEKESKINTSIVEHMEYLFLTDWYVTRFIETKKEIPKDIKVKRAEAREKISDLKKEL